MPHKKTKQTKRKPNFSFRWDDDELREAVEAMAERERRPVAFLINEALYEKYLPRKSKRTG